MLSLPLFQESNRVNSIYDYLSVIFIGFGAFATKGRKNKWLLTSFHHQFGSIGQPQWARAAVTDQQLRDYICPTLETPPVSHVQSWSTTDTKTDRQIAFEVNWNPIDFNALYIFPSTSQPLPDKLTDLWRPTLLTGVQIKRSSNSYDSNINNFLPPVSLFPSQQFVIWSSLFLAPFNK